MKWSNSAFYSACSELTNCNWRSYQLKESGWGKPDTCDFPTLAASSCVDMSRCGRSSSHPWAPVSCSYPSDIRPTFTLSLPIHTIHKLRQWKRLLWYETSESSVSATLSHRLRWSVISLHFLPEFIVKLKDGFQRPLVVKYSDKADSPLQTIEKKLDNKIRTKQHLKLTQSRL